jgi:hypothetical protein
MWFLVCDRSAARAEAEAEREGAARRHAARVRELEVQVCSGGARSLSGGRLGRYRTRRCWEIEKWFALQLSGLIYWLHTAPTSSALLN